MKKLREIWVEVKEFLRLLWVIRISIVMVSALLLVTLILPQVQDSFTALANIDGIHQYFILAFIGIIWALEIWYWARAFYYMEYTEYGLDEWQALVIKHAPRVLGALGFLIFIIAFLVEGFTLAALKDPDAYKLFVLSGIYIAALVLFILFVYFRRKIFNMPESVLYLNDENGEFLPFHKLPKKTKKILLISTILSFVLLVILTIDPIRTTLWLGNAVIILICCFCIWLPLLYLISYFSSRFRFPIYLALFIIAALFSVFNNNKNVRLTDGGTNRISLNDYYDGWYKDRLPEYKRFIATKRIPTIVVLSEGGGIRAAYWNAGVLAYLQSKNTNFSKYTFSICGISGGSFGDVVFESLMNVYKNIPEEKRNRKTIQELSSDIIGKDYLSPFLACTFSRQFIQLLCPFPVSAFDQAKVFEKTWEYHWEKQLEKNLAVKSGPNIITLDKPFQSLWDGDTDRNLPSLFLGTFRVEDGKPVIVGNLDFYGVSGSRNSLGLADDIYSFTSGHDIPLSTAASLTARFPFTLPAGILHKDKEVAGFLDGGIFDSSGAHLGYHVFSAIEKKLGNNSDGAFRDQVLPVVIYIRNASYNIYKSHPRTTFLYQMPAPVVGLYEASIAHSLDALSNLEAYIQMKGGIFVTVPIDENEVREDSGLIIPMGWSLSKSAQYQMDKRIPDLVDKNCKPVLDLLPR